MRSAKISSKLLYNKFDSGIVALSDLSNLRKTESATDETILTHARRSGEGPYYVNEKVAWCESEHQESCN